LTAAGVLAANGNWYTLFSLLLEVAPRLFWVVGGGVVARAGFTNRSHRYLDTIYATK